MKKWLFAHKRKTALGVGILVVLLAAFGVFQHRKSLDAPQEAEDSVTSEPAREIDAWGEVKYGKVYDVTVDFPASVEEIGVKEGDRVGLGDTLLTLDEAEYGSSLDQLKQQQAAAEADAAQTKADIDRKTGELNGGTNADLKLLQNSLDLAKREVSNAQKDLASYQSLYDSGGVSRQTLDQYADALAQKQKAQTDVEDNIEKTRSSLRSELDQLGVALKAKQSQLAQVNDNLSILSDKTKKPYFDGNRIVSCVKNGIVQNLAVNTATKLGAQNSPVRVLQLIDADSLVVSAEVQEEFIGSVRLGQTVTIAPTGSPKDTVQGKVTQIPQIAVEKDGRRIIRVEVTPQTLNQWIRPGYSADVYFPEQS